MRHVPAIVGAFAKKVGAKKIMQPLGRVEHVVVGVTCSVIVLIIFARWIELGQFRVGLVVGDGGCRRGTAIGGIEWQRRRPLEWRGNNSHAAKDVWSD